jgi:thiol-disulfide isomerase/thioredoxin
MTLDTAASPTPAAWRVVCLCAGWCGVCREYRSVFDALAVAHPQVRFDWVDVEDEEALVGDVDVETFPTLLIADARQAHFFGPLLPQAGVLERLLANLQRGASGSEGASAEAQALWLRLRAARE